MILTGGRVICTQMQHANSRAKLHFTELQITLPKCDIGDTHVYEWRLWNTESRLYEFQNTRLNNISAFNT